MAFSSDGNILGSRHFLDKKFAFPPAFYFRKGQFFCRVALLLGQRTKKYGILHPTRCLSLPRHYQWNCRHRSLLFPRPAFSITSSWSLLGDSEATMLEGIMHVLLLVMVSIAVLKWALLCQSEFWLQSSSLSPIVGHCTIHSIINKCVQWISSSKDTSVIHEFMRISWSISQQNATYFRSFHIQHVSIMVATPCSQHCDGDCTGLPHMPGNRMATMVMYCKLPTDGGSTNFRNSFVHVKPVAGNAIFFSYIDPITKTMDSGFTEHSGCPVFEGEKKIVTQWIRYGVDNENPWDSFNTLGIKISDADDQ